MTTPIVTPSDTLKVASEIKQLQTGSLTDAGGLTGTETLPAVRNTTLFQTTFSAIRNFILGSVAAQRQSIPVTAAGQATYVSSGYTVGLINVFVAGVRLNPSMYTATDGTNITITDTKTLARLVTGMTVDVEAAVSLAVSNAATVASVQAMDPANQTAIGTITGAELASVRQGSALFQTTLTKVAQWFIGTYQGFMQPGTGAAARTLQARLQDTVSVKDFGATGNGTTNDTAAIQAAINYVQTTGGGCVYFPIGTYFVSGTLAVTANKVTLKGENRQGTVINFNNGALDCLTVIGTSYAAQLYGFELKDIYISHTSKTGGRSLVIAYASQVTLRDVTLSQAWTGVEIWVTNNVVLDNFYMDGATGGASIPTTYYGSYAPQACYGVWWHAPGDNSARCDQLTTIATTLQLHSSGADGFVWDGLAQTWNAFQTTALGCRYGLHVLNSAVSPSYYPGFGEFDNFNTENMSAIGVLIEAGRTFQFVNCNLNNTSGGAGGSADTNAVRILADTSGSYTAGIWFTGCRIGLSAQGALYSAARDVIVSGCTILPGSTTTTNTYSGVEIASPAQDVIVSNCKCYEWGATPKWQYSIQVDAGTSRILVANNNLSNIGTRGILWNNNDLASFAVGNITSGVSRPNPSGHSVATGVILTASWMLGGALNLSGPAAAWAAVTDTAANIVASLANPSIYSFIPLVLINSSAYAVTITGGTGVTTTGNTLTIPANSQRVIIINIASTVLGSEAVVLYA